MHRSILACLIASLLVALSGCDQSSADSKQEGLSAPAGKYDVVCTIAMITDIVRQVAGDRANITGLLSEGVDPHTYNPTRSDVVKLSEADVVFYNGLMLEGKMADVFVRVARTGKHVFAVTDKLQDEGFIMTDEADHYDPHVWMDVEGWIKAVAAVAEALSEHDPAGADSYKNRGDAYAAELRKLDEYARTCIASIPKEQRVLVTAHDAFGYFGRAYDIEVRGIQGISTESEAGLSDLNNLVNFLVERKIGAVFVETSVADKYVQALIEGADAKGHTVRIGGRLFSDAMGKAGTYEGTYIGMIDHNVTTITRALGGNAPEKGMQGKLSNEPH